MKRPVYTAAIALTLIMTASACAKTPPPVTTTSAPPTTSKPAPTSGAPTTTAPATTAPVGQAPKYGGQLHLTLNGDISTFDDATQGGPGGVPNSLYAQELWGGDWAKGYAGGLGTKATDWGGLGYDTFANKTGYIAQSWTTNVDNDKGTATIVYTLRPGVKFGVNPNGDIGKTVNGRALTADDVMAAITQATTDTKGYIYRSNPELRNLDAKKTSATQITVSVPIPNLVTALSRLGDSLRVYPTETRANMTDWKNSVGTGPFIFSDYTSGSSLTFVKNPNYWNTDPIGPGKGNQLPYIDGIQFFILPDPLTRLAAFRTGKTDEIDTLAWEDAAQIKKEFPQMPNSTNGGYSSPGGFTMYMRTDKAPYNNLQVRRALMMATDFNSIKQNFNGGQGNIIGFPYEDYPEYHALYAGIDDPDLTPATKEQYVYNTDKAKSLLAAAGYQNGFKTSVLCTAAQSSYMEMIAGMWAKVGVTLNIDVKDSTVITSILNNQAYTDFTSAAGKAPTPIYYSGNGINGVPGSSTNTSFVDDAQVKDWLLKIRTLAATDPNKSMALAKQMMVYALDQAWTIQIPEYRTSTFWQPWLKNYSGEISVGYFNNANWAQYVWIDQTLKK